MQNLHSIIGSTVHDCRAAVRAVASSWNKFWYQPRSPEVLGLMRWLVGGMLVYTHLVWGLDLQAFLGADGWNSLEAVQAIQADWAAPSFWWYVPAEWMVPVHWTCIGILLMFWVGFGTRVTSVLSLCITISYSYRAHMSNFGLDQINAILCLYLCIGPSGACLSVDRLIRVWRWKRRHADIDGPEACPGVAKSSAANLAVRLTQLHFCVIYLYAGFSKLQGSAWWSGEAVWLAFANREYQSIDMTWIAWYPWISEVMTHTTIIWEVSFAAAIWVKPLRRPVLLVGFLLHLGIGGMMGMWTFGLIMIFGHVAFWPRETIAFATLWAPSAERLLKVPAVPQPRDEIVEEEWASSKEVAPLVLCVHRRIKRSLQCLNYLASRGFRCLSGTDNQAPAIREQAEPQAVILFGADMKDEEVISFQDEHFDQHNAQPLFLLLSETQAERLNGSVADGPGTVLSGAVSLRTLRKTIQKQLASDDQSTVADTAINN